MEISRARVKKNKVVPIDGEKAIDEGAGKYLSMLDNAPINVMMCDLDFNINYINPKSIETLKTIEQHLPIKVDEMLGHTIDVFHKIPTHQRKLLADGSSLPIRTIIDVAGEKLDLLVTSVNDNNGNYIGPMVTWDVVTEKLKKEIDMARINSMIENAPINIMMCDLEFNVSYMNPKSFATLKTLEEHLPIKVEDMVGHTIDVFHKIPAHQRKLLSEASNLPIQTIIDVAGEKLDLLVTATKDSDGNYIGPMVTWEVVTEKLKNEVDMARINSMIENAPINIMMCDLEFNVSYMNPKSFETLKTLEEHLPIKVSEMVGHTIDIFHKIPSHQRKLLSEASNLPIQTIIDVAGEKLDLLVTATNDKDGNYIGPMVTWDVVTEKLKGELEMARVSSMMENAPVNVLMCDLDFTVTYINPKSIETLRTLAKDLPVKVDDILGGSIDVFHKIPEMQRKLLSDDRNLPHQATISVGAEKLDLLVSAIYDNNKNYIGPMLTWEVVTEKLALIETLEETASQLGSSSEELSATATQMVKSAEQTSQQSNSAAAMSEEVATGVQTVATNTEEMTASIKEIAKSSSEASEISKEAMTKAQETNATIEQLGEASQEIGNVIKVISSIAQQTNLLALNATIEAARAGDAGKGFAVVANEVKELAKQTASATDDITNKINNIQGSSKEAVDAIGGIAEVIEKINNIAMAIAAAVEEQTATTNEVARVVQESNKGVEGITETVKVVAQAANESSTGANQTLSAAGDLSQLATKLKELVERVKS